MTFGIRPPKAVTLKSKTRPKKNVTPTPLAMLVAMPRDRFEHGVLNQQITRAPTQASMPPWLAGLEGLNLAQLDAERRKSKRRHVDREESKLDCIYPLVLKFEEILDADDPDRVINAHARSRQPKQNETRVRLWFYTYLLFNRNRHSLHYPTHQIGRWARKVDATTPKRGRPHKHLGKNSGHNTTPEMVRLMLKGWRREAKLGRRLVTIYENVMRKDFGCVSRRLREGVQERSVLVHPHGRAFPRLKTFVYHLYQALGRDHVQLVLRGYVRTRSRAPTKGAYTEQVWNLMQAVESDAYAVYELARGLIEGHPMPALYVVRRRDTASGMITGIGFSQGGERASAYRMALFCEAIGKRRFCALLGQEIVDGRWPCQGNSPRSIQDRGAGCTEDAFSRDPTYLPVVKEGAPSHAGQSKAVIESSNPKTLSDAEAPSFYASNLRTPELIRRELLRVLQDNETFCIRSRVPPDLADRLARPTPVALWNLLDSLGRNDAIQMPFEDAVRAYLSTHKATLSKEGVTFNDMTYRSAAFDEAGGRRMTAGVPSVGVQIYVFEACMRHIWIDLHGELLELDVTHAVPVGEEVLNMTFAEQKAYQEFVRKQDSFHAEHCNAVRIEVASEFRAATGKEWDAGSRVAGRPNRQSKAAKQEAVEVARAVGARR